MSRKKIINYTNRLSFLQILTLSIFVILNYFFIIHIIYKNIKGFKIPVESVVEKNNKLGVYVINEENNMPEFVGLGKNYYKDAKYYYVDYNKNKDENKLNLYDRILLYPNFINKNIKVSRWH